MNQDKRRQIIIREIVYWRNNKLLPEQYCDFLLNLYADETAAGRAHLPNWLTAIMGSHPKHIIYFLSGLTIIAILVFNFNVFPLPLQIGLTLLLIFFGYAYGLTHRKRKPLTANAAIGASSLLLLIAGPVLMRMHEVDQPLWIGGYIALCSLVWIVQGIIFRMGWFHFCGWAGLMLVYAWSVYRSVESLHWIHTQLMWLPLSFIFLWLSWFLHRHLHPSSKVFFTVGAIQFFIPDIISISMYGTTGWIQLIWIIKILIAGFLLYQFRNLWMKWVS